MQLSLILKFIGTQLDIEETITIKCTISIDHTLSDSGSTNITSKETSVMLDK